MENTVSIDSSATLSQLAISVPAASRVFKRHKLDFCCSGRRPLAEACRDLGLDPESVLEELEREASKTTEAAAEYASADELIDHILERYHEPLRQELPELIAMAKRVEVRHGDKPACPRGLAQHLVAMHAEVLDHLAKEEQILFPSIRSGMPVRGPVAVMQREHDDHGASLRQTRELTTDLVPPAGACATWRALYLRLAELESELMDHIHLENNILFPRALQSA